MKRLALALVFAACSSWDTGSDIGDGPRLACIDTVEAFARAAERCGADYRTSYDSFLRRDAAGDCRNVRSIRDEASLRGQCIPYVQSLSCPDLNAGKSDGSCARQLQRAGTVRF